MCAERVAQFVMQVCIFLPPFEFTVKRIPDIDIALHTMHFILKVWTSHNTLGVTLTPAFLQ